MPEISSWVLWGMTLYNVGCTLATSSIMWNYQNQNAWPGVCNSGQNQSPVDLGSNIIVTQLDTLRYMYPRKERMWTIINSGHSLEISIPPEDKFHIHGAGLPDMYSVLTNGDRLSNIRFHWANCGKGSEHLVDGEAYAAEMHLIHVRKDFPNITSALNSRDRDALAVIGIFMEIGNTANRVLSHLLKNSAIDAIKNTPSPSSFNVTMRLPLDRLLVTGPMYRYRGSLTSPNCNEVVAWTILANPISIREEELAILRSLTDSHGQPLENNFRELQQLNDRMVEYDPSVRVGRTTYDLLKML